MTSQEEQMLNSLVEKVNATQLTEKDPDAARLLADGFRSNPDAVYILAQSVLVQNIALEQAHQQLAEARQQPPKATSFLGALLGRRDPAPPQGQYQQVYSPQATEFQPPYAGQPNQGQPYPGQPYPGQAYGGSPFMGGSPQGQPSFLRSAAQTAAGVAAGALAFEGVESLLHGGFGHPGMGSGLGGWGMPGVGAGMGYERPVEENVVNNYYDSPGGERGGGHEGGRDFGGNDSGQLADDSWSDDGSGGSSGDMGNDSGFDSGDSGGGSGSDDGGF